MSKQVMTEEEFLLELARLGFKVSPEGRDGEATTDAATIRAWHAQRLELTVHGIALKQP